MPSDAIERWEWEGGTPALDASVVADEARAEPAGQAAGPAADAEAEARASSSTSSERDPGPQPRFR
jgi:hypothetical protein